METTVAGALGNVLTDMLVSEVVASLVDRGVMELGPRMPVGVVRAAVLETLDILPAGLLSNTLENHSPE